MESNIPLPTDNIYKFYALFGLLLFIFTMGSNLYVNRSTNALIFQTVIELETLKLVSNPSSLETAKKLVLERQKEIALSDKKFFEVALSLLLGGSMSLMAYGFRKWHREVQPVQDEMAQLQLEKLRYEVNQLTKSTSSSVVVETPQEESPEAED